MSAGQRIEAALSASAPLRAARGSAGELAGSAWVVGGAVRDALLGYGVGDLDLAVEGSPAAAARAIAAALDGHAFELSNEYDTWRVSERRGEETIDVAALRGPDITSDLRRRDFTVNAVAVPLEGGEPLDPTGGLADLEAGRLRLASAGAFEEDPLRLMRAARITAALDLEPAPETAAAARRIAARAAEPAGERRFAELREMVAGPDPLRALELMDELEITPVVLHELHELRGVGQSANHHLDVHAHTIEVLRRWLEVEADIGAYAGDEADAVAAALAEPLADGLTRRDGVRFAAILHDIGKPATRTEREGVVGFRGHDEVGAQMIAAFCRRLRTSRRFCSYLAALTRHHLVLGFLTHGRPLERRRKWDYIVRTRPHSLDVTMLTIADRLSAQGSGVPVAAIDAHLELAREMLNEIAPIERHGPPPPLLAGGEIAELLGAEGPEVGAAVEELAAAQFAGEVADREAAESHLREWTRGRD